MFVVRASNFTELYIDLLKLIVDAGELEAKTREIFPVAIVLENPEHSLLYHKKNWKWCFQELFDRMSGVFNQPAEYANPGLAAPYRPAWKRKLAKEGGKFHYAYGEVYNTQVPAVIKQLKKQKTTREAIINVWNSNYLEKQLDFNRRPCTLTIHFLIRNKKLHCFVNMRTNDVINLLPYDVFHHTFLQRYIAHELNLDLGSYTHTATHMYYPKRRELRNYFEKVFFTLENSAATSWEIMSTPIKSYTMDKDIEIAYKVLYLNEGGVENISSPLIKNLVNFITGGSLNQEFDFLNTR